MSKRVFKIMSAVLAVMLASFTLISCKKGNNAKTTIVVDGGGDIGNFNTTVSMTKSEVNPFPYNTLEKLCKEWEAAHPDYKVVVNKNSYGGSTGSLRPLFNGHTAPDIIYMNGTSVEEDKNKGWFVPLNKYLMQKNPYASEYDKWLDLYDVKEYASTSDGERYYVNLERIPIGIIYNVDILKAAGYTDASGNLKSLVSYSDFKEAQKCVSEYSVKNKNLGIKTFLTPYRWYDIYLETSLFGDLLKTCDRNGDGNLDTEEWCYAYTKGYWGVDTPAFKTYIELLKDRCEYFPDGYSQLIPLTEFVSGRCAFIEGVGGTLRQISANSAVNFEYAITGYPQISKADIEKAGFDSSCFAEELSNGRRGSAGYGTSWWITNSAMDKGQDAVDACADLLMFLTAPKQNNRLIGDLGGGIPLNPESEESVPEYLRPVLKMYLDDSKDESKYAWGVANSWNCFGAEYSSYFLSATYSYIDGEKTKETLLKQLGNQVSGLVEQFIVENEYDTSKW
ncbi:MAG: extracellular solute-binding protein [Candidatus Borkfalkiaceae bacterium]|nr:extracellular solute-binding protein [Christensenellaceae bacterium]